MTQQTEINPATITALLDAAADCIEAQAAEIAAPPHIQGLSPMSTLPPEYYRKRMLELADRVDLLTGLLREAQAKLIVKGAPPSLTRRIREALKIQ